MSKLNAIINKDSKKVDYFIPNDLEVKGEEGELTNKSEVDKKVWEQEIERKLSVTEGYNKDISNTLPDLSDFDLLGNYVLIRPFKIEVVEKTKSGLVLLNKTTEHYTDDRTNKTKVKEMVFPFQMKGIVVKYGDVVPEEFKNKIPLGSLVAFMPQPIHIPSFVVNTNEIYAETPEEYYTIKLPVSQLERVYKTNKYVD